MSLPKQDHRSTLESLAELTGRPAEEFEIPANVSMPAPEELDTRDAVAFYTQER